MPTLCNRQMVFGERLWGWCCGSVAAKVILPNSVSMCKISMAVVSRIQQILFRQ